MQIRRISQNEVSVYFSERELVVYDIKPGDKVPEAAALHKFLFELMDTVYNETGFDPYGGQVVVEATPMKHGMSFTISKLNRKLTKDEFKRIKRIRVKADGFDRLSDIPHNSLIDMLESIAEKHEKSKKPDKGAFIFSDFGELETALCNLSNEIIKSCSLYRDCRRRYAIVAQCTKESTLYNALSEFALCSDSSSVIADDITEGWVLVAEKNELAEMADALRKMQ